MNILYLNLKGEYFDQIKSGQKIYEFRLNNEYWKKRLKIDGRFKRWDEIVIRRGYPKANDTDKNLSREFTEIKEITIVHPHFGKNPVDVFAIRVNQ